MRTITPVGYGGRPPLAAFPLGSNSSMTCWLRLVGEGDVAGNDLQWTTKHFDLGQGATSAKRANLMAQRAWGLLMGDCRAGWGGDDRKMGFLEAPLPRIPPARPRVVQAFALAVHAAVAFCRAFFRTAALVGDFGHAFLLGGFAGAGFAAFGFGVCVAGGGQQAQCQADGQQGAEPVVGAGGGGVKGRHTGIDGVDGVYSTVARRAVPRVGRWGMQRHPATRAVAVNHEESRRCGGWVDSSLSGASGPKSGARYNWRVLHGARRTPVALPASGASKTSACGPSKGWLLATFKENFQ